MIAPRKGCVFCHPVDEVILWSDERCRVLHVEDARFPGFCRVVWNAHVRELTDIDAEARAHLMRVVAAVECSLRTLLAPDKMNIASLGNQVPHLHWHVIPRYRDDSHFPDAVWAEPRREVRAHPLPESFAAKMRQAIESALA